MNMLTSCCYCYNLKTGAVVIGSVEGVLGFITLLCAALSLTSIDQNDAHKPNKPNEDLPTAWISLVLGLATVCISAMLVVGSIKKKPVLILCWLMFTAFSTVIFAIHALCQDFDAIAMLVDALSAGVEIYFWFVVLSLYLEILQRQNAAESEVLFTRSETLA